MTISVAKFVAAPAASPAATAISSSTGQTESIVAGDFSDLLLGQLMGEQSAGIGVATGKMGEELAAEGTEATTMADTAQLFAALGLPVPASADLQQRPLDQAAGELMANARDTGTGHAMPLMGTALRQTIAENQPPAGQSIESSQKSFSDIAGGAATRESGLFSPTGDTGNAAKLAGAAHVGIEPLSSGRENSGVQVAMPTPVAHLAATQSPQPSPADSSLHIPTPVRDAAWPAELSQKVVWMSRQDLQSAQITLNPPQLGPIEISLDVKNEQASAVFVSGNAEVREAIESALPRLREMLAGIGVELGQTNVSHESFRQASEQNSQYRQAAARSADANIDRGIMTNETAGTTTVRARVGNGLVDTFA